MRRYVLLLIFASVFLFCQDSQDSLSLQEERITSFLSDVVIREDGVLEVTETIRVYEAEDGEMVRQNLTQQCHPELFSSYDYREGSISLLLIDY
ncbi:MAG: hypothetical protein AB7T10_00315 [bacterium]